MSAPIYLTNQIRSKVVHFEITWRAYSEKWICIAGVRLQKGLCEIKTRRLRRKPMLVLVSVEMPLHERRFRTEIKRRTRSRAKRCKKRIQSNCKVWGILIRVTLVSVRAFGSNRSIYDDLHTGDLHSYGCVPEHSVWQEGAVETHNRRFSRNGERNRDNLIRYRTLISLGFRILTFAFFLLENSFQHGHMIMYGRSHVHWVTSFNWKVCGYRKTAEDSRMVKEPWRMHRTEKIVSSN